jgi:hypothetical protein
MTKIGLYDIANSKTLESNKSLRDNNSAGSVSMGKTPFGEEVFFS